MLALEPCDNLVDGLVGHLGLGGTGQDERDQRLVDEYRVRLVDDRDIGYRRDEAVLGGRELVAQHVENRSR